MEFVIVTCGETEREVFVDNQSQGLTNTRLSVPEGLHLFDLGAPFDYAPDFQELTIENTTPTDPMTIAFTPLAAVVLVRAGKRQGKRPSATAGKSGTRSRTRKSGAKKAPAKKASAKKRSAKKALAPRSGSKSQKKRAEPTTSRSKRQAKRRLIKKR